MVSTFLDDPTVNGSGIIVLLGQVWIYAEKDKVLREEEWRTNLGGRESVEIYHKCKNWPNMSLFIARIL